MSLTCPCDIKHQYLVRKWDEITFVWCQDMLLCNLLLNLCGNGNKTSIGQPILRHVIIFQFLCEDLGEYVGVQDMDPKYFFVKQPLATYYFYALTFIFHKKELSVF